MKKLGIAFGIIVLLIGLLFIKNLWDSYKSYLTEDYYEAFISQGQLDMKYSKLGMYEVEMSSYNTDEGNIYIWHPQITGIIAERWPVIMVVNASNTRHRNLMPFFRRLASWGFAVVGNDDPQTGTGNSASLTLDYVMSLPEDDELKRHLDFNRAGIVGYSQGGAGAINAVTRYPNGSVYKALFTGSAAYAELSRNMGWEYQAEKVAIPWLMVAGTGASDDSGNYGEGKFSGVCPLFSLKENFEAVSDSIHKCRGRIAGAEHGDILTLSDGYMTAWMLFHLYGDEEAGCVFKGDSAEILVNSRWQDVQKNW